MAFIKIRGILVDILVGITPDVYKSYVLKDKKGSKQLLVQCQNALYGTGSARKSRVERDDKHERAPTSHIQQASK
jgi:hypothetical protein